VVSFDHVGAAVVNRARKAQPLLDRVAALRMAGGVLRAGRGGLIAGTMIVGSKTLPTMRLHLKSYRDRLLKEKTDLESRRVSQ